VSYKRQELLTVHMHMVSSPVSGGVSVGHLFSFLCCVRSVSCVLNVVSVSGLSILDLVF
jgi:hypothetical protein